MNEFSLTAFREAYPEFNDADKYPDAMIESWAAVAQLQVSSTRWKSQYLLGVNLYVAHEITLQAQQQASAGAGGAPSGPSGMVNSKTVGSVTVAFDTASAAEKDAGHWNLTMYGRQFIRLARIFGAGPVQR